MKPRAVPASPSARRVLLGALCALACSIPALAQTPPAPPPESDEVVELEPFTVQSGEDTYVVANSMVGTRVNIPLIDAPFSAQVVTDQLIRETGAANIQEALRYVSSVRSSSNIYEEFAIRGFNSGAPLRNYFNVPGALQARGDNVEYDRIEVLKGPTGLLYGNGQPGGRINVVTKKPLSIARRSFDVEVGDYEFYRAVADFTGPLAKLGDGQLLYRAIGAYQDSGGFRDYEHTSRTLLNGQLEWRSRRLSFRVEQRYLRQKEDAEAFILLPLGPGATPAYFLMPDREYNTAGPNTEANFREYNTYTELIWNIAENWTLRNGSSYSETYYDALRRVGAGLNAAGTHVTAIPVYNDNKNTATNSQTDLTGQFKLPIGKLTVVLGQIYGENESRSKQFNGPGAPFAVLDRSARTYDVPPFPSAAYNRTQYQLNEGKNERYYAMIQLTTLNDRLTILGGAGRSHAEPKVTNLQPAVPTFSTSSSWNTSPQFGGSFRIRKDLAAYLMYGESFSPNGDFPDQPEEGKSWEAGLKFGSERLSGTLAWFDTTRESIQVQAFDPVLARNVPSIAGKQTATGVELDIYSKLTDQTEVIASYAYLDTENVIPDVRFAAAAGTRLGDAPTHQAKLWVKQSFPDVAGFKNVWGGLGVIYVGDMVADHDAARFQLVAPSYTRFDFALGAERRLSGGQRLVFKINVENLFDEDYVEKQITRGWPRRFKASVGLKF
jgi:iron complex outermembrane receptor protein